MMWWALVGAVISALIGVGLALLLDRRAAPESTGERANLNPIERRIVDALRLTVDCDDNCGALRFPATESELHLALEHWADHSCNGGCSHGR